MTTPDPPSEPVPRAASRPRPTSSVVLILLGVAALLAVGGNMPFLGIPGALWMEVAAPVAGLFTDRRMAADAGWPMAILVTFVWPWFLPVSYLLAVAVLPRGQRRWALTLACTALGAIMVAAAFQVYGGRLG